VPLDFPGFGNAGSFSDSAGSVVIPDDAGAFAAKVTAVSGVKVGFREQQQDPATGVWSDAPLGRVGTAADPTGYAVADPDQVPAVGDVRMVRRHPQHVHLFQVLPGGAAGGSGLVNSSSSVSGIVTAWQINADCTITASQTKTLTATITDGVITLGLS